MKPLVIVGAGGFAREVLWLARRQGREIAGFLVDDDALQGQLINDVPVIGKSADWARFPDTSLVIAIGAPRARMSVAMRLKSQGQPDFATLVDPAAIVGDRVSIMPGAMICAGVICTTDIRIGEHAILNLNSTVGHDTVFGDFVTVAPNASISGNVVLGTGTEIGTGAALREKIVVGDGALVGMGSVVTRDVAPNSVVVGNPARQTRTLEAI